MFGISRLFVLVVSIAAVLVALTSISLAESKFEVTSLQGGNNSTFRVKKVTVKGQEFTSAWQVVTTDTPEVPWGYQLGTKAKLGITEGDRLFVTFWARCTDAGGGDGAPESLAESELVIELAKSPWTKAFTCGFTVGPQWTRYALQFVSDVSIAGGDSQIVFRAGYMPQAFQIGGVSLTDFGNNPLPQNVVLSAPGYAGSEPDAAWRKVADERIDRYRKGDWKISVVDAKGKPVNGASVKVEMKRHAFGWGSAIDSEVLLDDPVYQQKFLNLFNMAVIENHLKWPMLELKGYEPALESLHFLKAKGIKVRGHNMVWPGVDNLPEAAQSLLSDGPALEKLIADHVTRVTTATKGLVFDWDVINEPIWNHAVQDVLGRRIMADWFELARKADKRVRLTLNEAGALESPRRSGRTIAQNIANIKYLLDEKAPLGAIGLQAHYAWGAPCPMDVLSVLDKYAEFGLPIVISEFDVNVSDEKFKAAYTRDFLTAAFSHPAVDSILFWGFWAGKHWLPEGALYREDWSLRPLGQAYKDLVFRKWWTKAQGFTEADGSYKLRGFKGDYEVTVVKGKTTRKVKASLNKADQTLVVVM